MSEGTFASVVERAVGADGEGHRRGWSQLSLLPGPSGWLGQRGVAFAGLECGVRIVVVGWFAICFARTR